MKIKKRRAHIRKKQFRVNSLLLPVFLLILLPFILFAVQKVQQLISRGADYTCPTTSTQNYVSLPVISDYAKPTDPERSPEINMNMRGYEEINESTALVDYGGDVDRIMPPSIGTIFTRIPTIVKTYKVHMWDWAKGEPSLKLESNWPVNLIGIATDPGEILMGPKAGREIGDGNVLMLIFATERSATFVHGRGEDPHDGYFIHMDNFCLDPNLLAAYRQANSSGRLSMPVIKTGQVFGYGNGSDFRLAYRDSGDWMDPRARKDWWQESDAIPGSNYPANSPTQAVIPSPTGTNPTNANPTPINPSQTPNPLNSPTPTPQIFSQTPTPILPTQTPKPTPCIPNWCFIEKSDCCFDPICIVMGSVTNDPTKRCGVPGNYTNTEKSPQQILFEEFKNLFRSFF